MQRLTILLGALAPAAAGQAPPLEVPPPVAVPVAELGSATSVEPLASGHLLVAFASGLVAVLDADTGATLHRYGEPRDFEPRCWLSPGQRHIATGSLGGPVEIRRFDEASLGATDAPKEAASETVVVLGAEPIEGEKRWNRAAWAPGGQHFVSWGQRWMHGAPTHRVRVWALDGSLTWEGPLAADAAVHPKLDQLAIVEADRVTIGWPDSGFRTIELPGAYGAIEYSPDGTRLAVGGTSAKIAVEGEDRVRWFHRRPGLRATLTILDAMEGEVLAQTQPAEDVFPKTWLQRVSWSPTGDHLGFSAGKGYLGGILRVEGMKTLRNEYGGGQMGAILGGFWVSDELYRPRFVIEVQPNYSSLLFDVSDPDGQRLTPQPGWYGVTPMKGTEDVIARHAQGIARVTPSTMAVVWAR